MKRRTHGRPNHSTSPFDHAVTCDPAATQHWQGQGQGPGAELPVGHGAAVQGTSAGRGAPGKLGRGGTKGTGAEGNGMCPCCPAQRLRAPERGQSESQGVTGTGRREGGFVAPFHTAMKVLQQRSQLSRFYCQYYKGRASQSPSPWSQVKTWGAWLSLETKGRGEGPMKGSRYFNIYLLLE